MLAESENLEIFFVITTSSFWSAQDARNRTLAVHELVDSPHLGAWQAAGSESTITDITGYTYFSLIKPSPELRYVSEQNIVSLALMVGLCSFHCCET